MDQSFQLEPAQLAGFNQTWRSLIPESVAGANEGAHFENWGVALDQKLPTGTYLGLAGEWLKSSLDRVVGVYDVNPPSLNVFPLPPFIVPSSTRQRLDYEEKTLTATVNQLLGNEWGLSASYRVSLAGLDSHYGDVPAGVPTAGGFVGRQDLEATLQQVTLGVLYTHRCGFLPSSKPCGPAKTTTATTLDGPGTISGNWRPLPAIALPDAVRRSGRAC